MTSRLHRLCALDELEEGAIRQGELPDGHKVAIYRVDGDVFVTDDRCSHGEASLSEDGSLDGCTVECSWHFGSFDIRTGEPQASPCTEPIRTYRVVLQGSDVFVEAVSAVRIAAAVDEANAPCGR
jgi:p-cumate 2,3-dioxygenase ferredoxin component